MQTEELKIDNYKEVIGKSIDEKKEIVLYAVVPTNLVYKGKGDIDEEFCIKNNYQIYNSIDFGGGIVATKGDLIFVILKENGWEFGDYILNEIIDFLKSQNLNASQNGNDILIDNIYKVASFSSVNVGNGLIYIGLQITFNSNAEDIKKICLKNSVKIPRGLNYYNINNQEVLNFVLSKIKGESL